MTRYWKMLSLHTVLAVVLAAPAFAGQTDGPAKPEDKIDTLLKEMRDLKKRFDELDTSLKGKIENLDTSTSLKLARAQMDLDELRKQVQQVRQDIDAMRGREIAALRRDLDEMTKSRQSMYAPTPLATGRLQLRNTFGEMVLILVNNKPYHIFPGQNVVTDPIPAGTFTYEVVGIQPQLTRPLTANETYTIHVHPR